jgi:hypothetical protein
MIRRAAVAAFGLIGACPLAAFGADAKTPPAKAAAKAAPTTPAPKTAETKTPAKTEPPPPAPAPAPPSGETPDADLGHRGQFNFRADFATGYRMLFRYDQSPRCAPHDYTKGPADQQKFCGFGAAPAIDLAIGFSAVDFFEPYLFAKLGLANEADHSNQGKLLQVGIGARLYTMSDSRFKIFFAPAIGLDLTSGPVEPIGSGTRGSPGFDDQAAGVKNESYRTDILAQLSIGPQFDVSRYVGVYVAGGLTFQMLRYLGASADLALGVQLRAP